jgi:magnesium transporter
MRAFTKNNNGLFAIPMDQTAGLYVLPKQRKKYLLEELQIPEAFYNDIEDIDERPRIEIENGWTLIIMHSVKSNDVNCPFIPFLLGLCLKVKFALPLVFIKQKCLQIL